MVSNNLLTMLSVFIEERPEFDLACVGTSIRGLKALTVESLVYLGQSDVVYYYPVTPKHLEFMRLINDDVVDLSSALYTDGGDFQTAYANIIDEILGAVKSGKKVAYAEQGSPAFLAYTSIEVRRRAKAEGFNTVMIPGVSSFECILAELTAVYDVYDLQVYNCGTVVHDSSKLNPNTACILFNLHRFASPVISKTKNRLDPERTALLAKEVGKKYPAAHVVKLITMHPDGRCGLQSSTVAAFKEDVLRGPYTATLFIPPVR